MSMADQRGTLPLKISHVRQGSVATAEYTTMPHVELVQRTHCGTHNGAIEPWQPAG